MIYVCPPHSLQHIAWFVWFVRLEPVLAFSVNPSIGIVGRKTGLGKPATHCSVHENLYEIEIPGSILSVLDLELSSEHVKTQKWFWMLHTLRIPFTIQHTYPQNILHYTIHMSPWYPSLYNTRSHDILHYTIHVLMISFTIQYTYPQNILQYRVVNCFIKKRSFRFFYVVLKQTIVFKKMETIHPLLYITHIPLTITYKLPQYTYTLLFKTHILYIIQNTVPYPYPSLWNILIFSWYPSVLHYSIHISYI